MDSINNQLKEGLWLMNNLTKIKILKPVNDVFEAFVDPKIIGNFWFSSSSER